VTAPVTTVRPQQEALRRTIEQPGQIEAFERTALYAKIAGFVQSYQVDIGDRIRKGQLLAELWVPEFVADLRQKEATVTQDEAETLLAQEALRAAVAGVNRAEARLQLAEASHTRAQADVELWNAEHRRDRKLVFTGTTSREGLEITTNKYRSAKAALDETSAGVNAARATLAQSKAQRDKADADVQVAKARLLVAKAERERAAAIVGYARIEAPYDGVVARRDVDTGAYVQAPAGNKTTATPLFEVVRTDLVRVFVDVPEADAPFVGDGGSAQVQVQALGDRDFEGRVTRSSWLLANQTRTLRTEIDLPNPQGLFRPGMYAYARLPVLHRAR
jgi:multidrug resistance efflux pump